MSKVTIDVDGLKALREHARRAGTLDAWSDIALEFIDAIIAAGHKLKEDSEQYRKNWRALQDATGEDCLDLAIGKVQAWKENEPQT